MFIRLIRLPSALATMMFFLAGPLQAALVVTAVESGGNVVFTTGGGGSLDLSGLMLDSNPKANSSIYPGFPNLVLGGGINVFVDKYIGSISAPANFGTGGINFVDSGSGDVFGYVGGTQAGLLVPTGYISGDSLSGSSTYTGETFATLGLNPGSYVWSLPSDTLTLNIVSTVPIPAGIWLFGSALGLLAWTRRKRS